MINDLNLIKTCHRIQISQYNPLLSEYNNTHLVQEYVIDDLNTKYYEYLRGFMTWNSFSEIDIEQEIEFEKQYYSAYSLIKDVPSAKIQLAVDYIKITAMLSSSFNDKNIEIINNVFTSIDKDNKIFIRNPDPKFQEQEIVVTIHTFFKEIYF